MGRGQAVPQTLVLSMSRSIMCLPVEKLPGRTHVPCGGTLLHQVAMASSFRGNLFPSHRADHAQPHAPPPAFTVSVSAFLCEKRVVIQGKHDSVGATWEVAAAPTAPRQEPFEVLSTCRHHPLAIHFLQPA